MKQDPFLTEYVRSCRYRFWQSAKKSLTHTQDGRGLQDFPQNSFSTPGQDMTGGLPHMRVLQSFKLRPNQLQKT